MQQHKEFLWKKKKSTLDKVGEQANDIEQNDILLQQTKEGSNLPCNKFHYKSGLKMNNTWSDDYNSSVSSSDDEGDKFPTECNNGFEVGFKKPRWHYKDVNWHEKFPNFDKKNDYSF